MFELCSKFVVSKYMDTRGNREVGRRAGARKVVRTLKVALNQSGANLLTPTISGIARLDCSACSQHIKQVGSLTSTRILSLWSFRLRNLLK